MIPAHERSELSDTPLAIRSLLALAIPLAAQQLGFQLMGTVDAALLGHHDDSALAAAGIGNNLLFVISSIGLGIVMGLDTVIPQAIGAGRSEDARRALHAGLRLALLVGLAATVIVFAMPLVLTAAAIPDEVVRDTRVYVYLRSLGIIPYLLSVALRSYLAARNVTRPLVIAVLAGNVLNLLLDLVLIFGVDAIGLPALGIIGASIATVSVQVLTVVVYLAAVRALDGHEPLPRSTRADLAQITRYGGPVGGQMFAEIGIFGIATVLAAHLGRLSAAAHIIALNLITLTYSIPVGIGAATSVRVGHALGAGDLELARRRGIIGLGLGVAVMATYSAILLLMPTMIARLFTDDAAVVLAVLPLLQIAAWFQLSDGTQAIAAGALRGLGDTRATLVANLLGHYAIGLTLSLALGFGLGLGTRGLWWGLSAGLTATAVFLVVRFLAATRRPRAAPGPVQNA